MPHLFGKEKCKRETLLPDRTGDFLDLHPSSLGDRLRVVRTLPLFLSAWFMVDATTPIGCENWTRLGSQAELKAEAVVYDSVPITKLVLDDVQGRAGRD